MDPRCQRGLRRRPRDLKGRRQDQRRRRGHRDLRAHLPDRSRERRAASENCGTVTIHPPGDQTSFIGSHVTLPITATKPDPGTLSYTAHGLPPGLAIDSGTGTITGTPTTAGTYQVEIDVTDSTGLTGSTTFTWTIPSLSATNPGEQRNEVNTPVSLQIQASDTDPNAVVELHRDRAPGRPRGQPHHRPDHRNPHHHRQILCRRDGPGLRRHQPLPLPFTWLIENPPNYGHWVGSEEYSAHFDSGGNPPQQSDIGYTNRTNGSRTGQQPGGGRQRTNRLDYG